MSLLLNHILGYRLSVTCTNSSSTFIDDNKKKTKLIRRSWKRSETNFPVNVYMVLIMVKYLCKKKELLCALKVGIQNSFLKDKCS
jgi:hypothetical protein